MATLVLHPEDEPEIVVPVVDSVRLGSAEGNDVTVEDPSIAPSHAEITLNSSGAFVLRDLGSATGTFVNGKRVKAHRLDDGDELVFGALRGRFVLTDEDRAAVSRRKPADQMEKEYEDALHKHRMLLGVLQGLAGEENKRMANLERLQQAVVSAESAQAIAEAKVRKAEDEALKIEKRVAASEAQAAELDVLAQAREDQVATSTRRLHHAEEERKALQARVDALAGTEQQLLQARYELEKSRMEHAALIALVAERDVRQHELEEIRAQFKELTEARTKARQELTDARTALEQFQRGVADQRLRLAAESQSLDHEAAIRRENLAVLTQQLQETTATHEDLLIRNRQLEGVDERLRLAREDLASIHDKQFNLATRMLALENDADQAHTKLQALQAEVESVTSVLDRHRADEAALKKSVADLQIGQADETKRLEEIRQLAAETERKAAGQHTEIDAVLEHRRRDIVAQEDRFHAIQSLHEEIDELYAKLEAGGEDPAAALEAWKDARKKKEELASLLPNEDGIRVRPQVRTVLVPRSKDM